MPPAKNVVIMMHGMTPDTQPSSPDDTCYRAFRSALLGQRPELSEAVDGWLGIQWGHPLPENSGQQPRNDERLMGAQNFLHELTSYRIISNRPGPNNVVMSGVFGKDCGVPILRGQLLRQRETHILRGLGDVVYYSAADGEKEVRRVVYDQVLRGLDPFIGHREVRLHIFGHSLGVTIAHDFLYGLFCRDPLYRPGFVQEQQGAAESVRLFEQWRAKAQNGTVKLGSLASAASQLPLFAMRRQAVLDRLYDRSRLDPADIGVTAEGRVQWKIFYDVDDLLAFPTRELYEPRGAIMDIQVNCGRDPVKAHAGYWSNGTVIRETAALIAGNIN